MKIIFLEQYLEGFLSWQNPTTLQLDRGATLNLIKGENGNGKTSLIGAIPFTLFGEIVKDITKKEIPTKEADRTPNFKGTCVRTKFRKGDKYYIVARHIKYKEQTLGITGGDSLLLFEGTNEELTDKDLRSDLRYNTNVQEEINSILGVDVNIFMESIFFAQDKERLISAKREDNLKMFESLFESTWIKSAKENAEKDKKEKQEEINKLEHEVELLEKDINNIQNSIQEKREYKAKWESSKTEAVKELKTKISLLKDNLYAYTNSIETYSKALDFDESEITLAEKRLAEVRADNSISEKEKEKDALVADKLAIDKLKSEILEKEAEYFGTGSELYLLKKDVRIAEQEKENFLKANKEAINSKTDSINESEMNIKRLRRKQIDYQDKINIYIADIETLTDAVNNINSKTCTACGQVLPEKDIEKHRKDLQKKLSEKQDFLVSLQDSLATIRVDKLETQLETAKMNLSLLEEERKVSLVGYDAKIVEINKNYTELEDKCDSVLASFDDELEQLENSYKDKLNSIEREIKLVSERIAQDKKNAENSLKIALKRKEESKESLQKIENLKQAILSAENNIKTYSNLLIQKEVEQIQDLGIDALVEKSLDFNNQKTVLSGKLSDIKIELEKIAWWVSTGFGNSGLKAYIFTASLAKLNMYAKKYAQQLGYEVSFSMDLEGTVKKFTVDVSFAHNGQTVTQSYGAFSGGEKQKINIAILFAMYDLVSSKFDCNILQLDEVFKGLTSSNINIVFEIIRDKVKDGKSIYLITHKNDVDTTYSKVINVDKNQHTSYIC